jgi:hypothetical protein
MTDPEVRRLSAEDGRVPVSRDFKTIPLHFATFVATGPSRGVVLIPYGVRIGQAIERLLTLWPYGKPKIPQTKSGGSHPEEAIPVHSATI